MRSSPVFVQSYFQTTVISSSYSELTDAYSKAKSELDTAIADAGTNALLDNFNFNQYSSITLPHLLQYS